MYTGLDNWREPNVCDLKKKMREAFELWLNGQSNKWDKMREAAKVRAAEFDNSIIGPILRDKLMYYYRKWRNCNVA
jgi:hypothetical protein